MTRALTIAIAAGGTGGHMFPAEALAHELLARGHKVFLISDARGLGFPGLFKGLETFRIESGTFARQGPGGALKAGWQLLKGLARAYGILLRKHPDGVVGFGGYPVAPVGVAARLLSLPSCLHEQNAVLGRANRALAGRASAIALSFEPTLKMSRSAKRKAVFTGNPVRGAIAVLADKPYPSLGPDHVLRLLVVGGSQGAKIFADVVPDALALLPKGVRARLQVTQQCRPEDLERVEAAYKTAGIAAQAFTFIKDIPGRLLWSHLVIARAGATTLSETAAAGRPAIMVPLASALDDHQSENAKRIAEAEAGWVLAEKDFTARALAKLVQRLVTRKDPLQAAAKAARGLGRPLAAAHLADLVEDMALRRYRRPRPRAQAKPSGDAGAQEFRGAFA
jgi:UDP-N-acetylglucosamine--N-acetylmuramyl-(pentapeptide) pyrophosphoryl-undecaprenol N-acetylglucosamine transferase